MPSPDIAVFIGQSPLQILNLVEAGRVYGHSGPMLVVYDEDAIRRQIESVLTRLGVTDVRFQRRHLLFRIGFPLLLMWRYGRLRGRVDTVFFGTYTSWATFLVNLLRAKRHVLVDDGQKTINIVTAPRMVGLGRQHARSLLSRRYVDDAELFTFYDELARRHGRRARPNRLASVGAQLMAGNTTSVPPVGADDILFIGTNVIGTYAPFEQAMVAVMSAAGGRRLLYLRHRRDDVDQVAALAAKLGFESHGFDLPLELVFHHLWAAHRPAVWTFGTTATDTLQSMYGDLRVRVFRLDPAGFTTPRLAAAFESICAHYRSNPRAEVVELVASVGTTPPGQGTGALRSQTASK
jgi:hypothetical protein